MFHCTQCHNDVTLDDVKLLCACGQHAVCIACYYRIVGISTRLRGRLQREISAAVNSAA